MKRLLIAVLIVLSWAGQAAASERVSQFEAEVLVSRNGSVNITETIVYDFADAADRHGIFRDIPIDYQSDDGKSYYPQYQILSVTNPQGQPVRYQLTEYGGMVRIKIGEANNTVAGQQAYRLQYRLYPLIIRGSNGAGDTLALDINGTGWSAPTSRVAAKVRFEGNPEILDYSCFTGAQGATGQQCSKLLTADGELKFEATALAPRENLTVAVMVPAGSFTAYLEAGQRRPIQWRRFAGPIAGLAAFIGSLLWLLATIVADHRRKKRQTIIAEYEPPAGLTPAEIGHLVDDQSNMTEVTATLIDLAVRGYIKIEQTRPKSWWRPAQYRFSKVKDLGDLPEHEAALLSSLFNGQEAMMSQDISQTSMSQAVEKFHNEVGKKLEAKSYYTHNPKTKLLGGLLLILVVLPRLLAILAAPVLAASAGYYLGQSLMLAAVAAGVMWFTRRRARLTPQGFDEWADIKGFQHFLSVTEKDRLAFHDAPERTPAQFSQLLPYAVALGVERQWAKQFAGMEVAPAVAAWYYPYSGSHFAASDLASNIRSDFGSVVSSSFTAPSSSGSGFSGGSSGGGFGGGGGGSW